MKEEPSPPPTKVPPYGVVGSVLEQLAAVLRSVVRSLVITPPTP